MAGRARATMAADTGRTSSAMRSSAQRIDARKRTGSASRASATSSGRIAVWIGWARTA